MKYLKYFEENILRFNIGDIVYANSDLIQNQLMIDKKMKIIQIYDSGYYLVDIYPRSPLSSDRLISEEEYNSKKFNL